MFFIFSSRGHFPRQSGEILKDDDLGQKFGKDRI